jgi:hypothetical protein
LEHDAHAPLLGRHQRAFARYDARPEGDRARIGRFESGDQTQQRRFSAARRAQQRHEFAVGDAQARGFERAHALAPRGREAFRHAVEDEFAHRAIAALMAGPSSVTTVR